MFHITVVNTIKCGHSRTLTTTTTTTMASIRLYTFVIHRDFILKYSKLITNFFKNLLRSKSETNNQWYCIDKTMFNDLPRQSLDSCKTQSSQQTASLVLINQQPSHNKNLNNNYEKLPTYKEVNLMKLKPPLDSF